MFGTQSCHCNCKIKRKRAIYLELYYVLQWKWTTLPLYYILPCICTKNKSSRYKTNYIPLCNNMDAWYDHIHVHSRIIDLQFEKTWKQYLYYSQVLSHRLLVFLGVFNGSTTMKLKWVGTACFIEIFTSFRKCLMGQQLPMLEVNINSGVQSRLHILDLLAKHRTRAP